MGRREEEKEKTEVGRIGMIKRRGAHKVTHCTGHVATNIRLIQSFTHTQGDSLGAAVWLHPLIA